MRSHPHLYEIAAWPWLERLSASEGRYITLGSVPDAEWDRLKAFGFDMVYLMGVWRRSPLGRHIARSERALFEAYDAALPGWTLADVVGSPYCIAGYSPDPRVGTWDELDAARAQLHRRGIQLVLDFVPNHTAFDHPWVASHPDRYVKGPMDRFRAAPGEFRVVDGADGAPHCIACARDPHFAPWTDVAQLNYFEADTRAAMIEQLVALAAHCDGVRCDMAMLVLNDVFARTWGTLVGLPPDAEFWAEARAAVPGLTLIGEAYWDLEPRLQALGFSFTYDKRLLDRLAHDSPSAVRDHLRAPAGQQVRSVRFLENHDEPRSLLTFDRRLEAAAAIFAMLPGLRFYYDGQLEGRVRYSPVQLARWSAEPVQAAAMDLYGPLLKAADEPVCHEGDWALLEVAEAGDSSHGDLIAFRWKAASDLRVVVANPGHAQAQGRVRLGADLPGCGTALIFEDRLHDDRYERDVASLAEHGLYVRLAPGRAHVFSVFCDRRRHASRSGVASD